MFFLHVTYKIKILESNQTPLASRALFDSCVHETLIAQKASVFVEQVKTLKTSRRRRRRGARGGIDLGEDTLKDYTKPRQTIQRPQKLYKDIKINKTQHY